MFKSSVFLLLGLFTCSSEASLPLLEPKQELEITNLAKPTPIYSNSDYFHQFDELIDLDQYIQQMTLDEKIGQLFWVEVFSNKGQGDIDRVKSLIKNYNIGGIIWFRDTKQKSSPALQLKYTNELQRSSKYPLIVSIDGEWGLNMRLDSTIQFPRQLELGAIQDNQLVYDFGVEVGQQLKRMGIHFNFAPVVDVNNNPNNPVINDRSFGENKYNVTDKSLAYMMGMHQAGILCTAKHFPGHGDTATDSHKDLPVINHDTNRLFDIELYPFQQLINNRIGGIMVAHLHIPSLDPTPNIPTTLSKPVVTDLLQNQLQFDGLIVTDAMNMQGVAKNFPSGQAEVMALQAGNDILLYTRDVPQAIRAIKAAITHGELTEDRINKSVKKVLAARRWLGILDHSQQIPTQSLSAYINGPLAQNLNKKLRRESITLVKNDSGRLPYTDLGPYTIASVGINDGLTTSFQRYLGRYAYIQNFSISLNASEAEYQRLLQQLSGYNQVIVGLVPSSRYKSAGFGISNSAISFLNQLDAQNKLVLSVFGNPYSLDYFSNFKELIAAYDDDEINQEAVAEAIFGALPFKGKLPVGVLSIPYGTGIQTTGNNRLQYRQPEEYGIPTSRFWRIDSIANSAITVGAAPGCVVMIVKDNKVIYNKAYGYHTYSRQIPTMVDDIFDLASITKIAGSMPAIMHAYETGDINLNGKLSDLIPEFQSTNKGDMKIAEILNHTAGLKSWIPFYQETITSGGSLGSIYRSTPSQGYKQVADNIYIQANYERDSMLYKIGQAPNGPRGKYVYSDMGFYAFKNFFERRFNQSYDQYINDTFYKRVGFPGFTYNPLNKFARNRIVPTEEDNYFRHQTVHGYVHDMGAAMEGGVGGHAGLFGSAYDLATYMQLLLNKGTYGGVQYFQPKTIEYFTSQYNQNSRKGIGFDKPEKNPNRGDGPTSSLASSATFGHTGFTGTFAFADPVNQLTVIFLSNRTYPTMTNNKLLTYGIRPRIQEEAYRIFNGVELKD